MTEKSAGNDVLVLGSLAIGAIEELRQVIPDLFRSLPSKTKKKILVEWKRKDAGQEEQLLTIFREVVRHNKIESYRIQLSQDSRFIESRVLLSKFGLSFDKLEWEILRNPVKRLLLAKQIGKCSSLNEFGNLLFRLIKEADPELESRPMFQEAVTLCRRALPIIKKEIL